MSDTNKRLESILKIVRRTSVDKEKVDAEPCPFDGCEERDCKKPKEPE